MARRNRRQAARDFAKRTAIRNIVDEALRDARAAGVTKDYDVALHVIGSIEAHARINLRPDRREQTLRRYAAGIIPETT